MKKVYNIKKDFSVKLNGEIRMIERIKNKSLSKLTKGTYQQLISFFSEITNPRLRKINAVSVMDEEWDNLIVLDACRYDTFKNVVNSEVDFKISQGSATSTWIKNNFNGNFSNTICIAGNPHLSSIYLKDVFGFNPFKRVIEVWDFGWDKRYKTVPPKNVRRAALSVIENSNYERLLIHFNQPHHPFLSDKDLLKLDDGTWNEIYGGVMGGEKTTVWDALRKGEVSVEKAKYAYIQNLKLVMKEVRKLTKHLEGKTVITADHGNLFGEYLLYGHPNVRVKELVEVPWFEIKNTTK